MCSCRFNSPKPFTQWRILLLRNLQALFFPSVLHFFPFLFSCNNWFTDKSIYPGLMISAKSTFYKQPHWATTLPTVKLQQTFPERWAKHLKYKKKYKNWHHIEGGRERGCCVMRHAGRGARCAGGIPKKPGTVCCLALGTASPAWSQHLCTSPAGLCQLTDQQEQQREGKTFPMQGLSHF